jgi:biotin transport system substrate-specific component
MCYIGLFAAVISACAFVSIPLPNGVPMTLQTFAIPLAGVVLGKKCGVLAAVIYLLRGAAGVPVFHGGSGGLGIIFGPTGGFILSFPLLALAAGIGASKRRTVWLALWLILGAVVNYICGMLWFVVVMPGLSLPGDLKFAFMACVFPFLLMDAGKMAMVTVLGNVKQLRDAKLAK